MKSIGALFGFLGAALDKVDFSPRSNTAQQLYDDWRSMDYPLADPTPPKVYPFSSERQKGRGAPTEFTPAPSGPGPDMESFGLRQVNRAAERRQKKHARRVILDEKRKIRFEKTRERQSARELRIAAGEEKAGFLMAVIRSRPSRLRSPVTIVEQL